MANDFHPNCTNRSCQFIKRKKSKGKKSKGTKRAFNIGDCLNEGPDFCPISNHVWMVNGEAREYPHDTNVKHLEHCERVWAKHPKNQLRTGFSSRGTPGEDTYESYLNGSSNVGSEDRISDRGSEEKDGEDGEVEGNEEDEERGEQISNWSREPKIVGLTLSMKGDIRKHVAWVDTNLSQADIAPQTGAMSLASLHSVQNEIPRLKRAPSSSCVMS
jgi:hypothetical protein